MQIPPDSLWHRYRWQNRLHALRAQGLESLFSGIAWAAFLALALFVLDPHWTKVFGYQAAWAHPATGLAVFFLVILAAVHRLVRGLRACWQKMRSDWLSALPIAPPLRLQHARRQVHRKWLGWAGLGALLLAWAAIRAPVARSSVFLALCASLASLLLIAPWVLQRTRLETNPEEVALPRVPRSSGAPVPVAVSMQGLKILGCVLQKGTVQVPRIAWVLGIGLLSLPMGSGAWVVLGVVLEFWVLALAMDSVTRWRLHWVANRRWLAVQPLTPARMFASYRRFWFWRVLMLGALSAGAGQMLGIPFAFLLGGILVLWMGMAHAVCVGYATGRNPGAYLRWLILHYALFLGCLQAMPPLLPMLWLVLVLWLWRRGNRGLL